MRIGELATATGVEVETIRYYERAGLLPAPERLANGYRAYGPLHQRRLAFIRHCRLLDMPLADIQELLARSEAPALGCDEVNRLLAQHLGHVRQKLQALTQLEQQLLSLSARCTREQTVADCGILHELMRAAEGDACACHEDGVAASAATHHAKKSSAFS